MLSGAATSEKRVSQLGEAVARGFTPQSKAGDFTVWLKEDYDVDSGGTHSDPSTELRLDGIDRR